MFMFGIHARAVVEGFESHPRCGICSCDGRNRIGAAEQAPGPVPPAVERRALQPPINSVGDRAISGPHAFPLNVALGNNPLPTNRDF